MRVQWFHGLQGIDLCRKNTAAIAGHVHRHRVALLQHRGDLLDQGLVVEGEVMKELVEDFNAALNRVNELKRFI